MNPKIALARLGLSYLMDVFVSCLKEGSGSIKKDCLAREGLLCYGFPTVLMHSCAVAPLSRNDPSPTMEGLYHVFFDHERNKKGWTQYESTLFIEEC